MKMMKMIANLLILTSGDFGGLPGEITVGKEITIATKKLMISQVQTSAYSDRW